jgi:hypothetical protein
MLIGFIRRIGSADAALSAIKPRFTVTGASWAGQAIKSRQAFLA